MLSTSHTVITDRKMNIWQAVTPDQTEVGKRTPPTEWEWTDTALLRGRNTIGGKADWRERTLSLSELDSWASLSVMNREPREQHPTNDADQANEDRLVLLARQYARQRLNSEDRARLEIVTERVKQLFPSVTEEEVDRLEGVLARLGEINASTAALRATLGLKKLE